MVLVSTCDGGDQQNRLWGVAQELLQQQRLSLGRRRGATTAAVVVGAATGANDTLDNGVLAPSAVEHRALYAVV